MVYRVDGVLKVNEDHPSENTIIHISTDFIHKKGDSRFRKGTRNSSAGKPD